MSHLTIDFETRSACDIKLGAWKYAEHPTTSVMCLCVKVDDEAPRVWVPDALWPDIGGLWMATEPFELLLDMDIEEVFSSADTIEAHNMGFERAMWHHHMHKKYGFEDLILEKCRCSAAKAAMHAIPRSLAVATQAIGLAVKKDMEGHKLMMKMCKPRNLVKAELIAMLAEEGELQGIGLAAIQDLYRTVKANKFNDALWKTEHGLEFPYKAAPFLRWHEEPEQIIRLIEYCMQDVEAEHALSEALEDLPPLEQKIWELDQKINQRGIPVDDEAVRVIIKKLREAEEGSLLEMSEIIQNESIYT